MASGRLTADDYPAGVERILRGVVPDPTQRADAVLDGRRGLRGRSHAVLDVDHVPTHLHPRQHPQRVAFFRAPPPSAAVDEDHRRERFRILDLRTVDVELEFDITHLAVDDVRLDEAVVDERLHRPTAGGRKLGMGRCHKKHDGKRDDSRLELHFDYSPLGDRLLSLDCHPNHPTVQTRALRTFIT